MYKLIDPRSFNFQVPLTQHIKAASRGLLGHDRRELEKRASASLLHRMDEMLKHAHADETYLHAIALGATEYTGPNRNGDGWRAQTLRETHPTFVKYARLYRDHDSKDPKKSYGYVLASAFNEDMPRVELIIALNNNKTAAARNNGLVADRELQKLAEGKEIPLSMGCLTDPSTLVLTSNGYKAIGDIVVGDLVYTHAGNWKRVTQLRRRNYTGDVVSFKIKGMPEPIEVTADHPFYAKVLHTYTERTIAGVERRPLSQWLMEAQGGARVFGWVHATHLQARDRIAVKAVTGVPSRVGLSDTRFAELLGTYLAEGNIGFNGQHPKSVMLTVHADDWATDNILSLVQSIWSDVTVTLTPKSDSKCAFSLEIHSAVLASWVLKLCGHHAKKKYVPLELFNSADDIKLAFLGRWLDGDGWPDQKGIHWSSANYKMLLEGRDLFLSLGIPAAIYKIKHKANKLVKKDTTEYTLNVSWLHVARLQPWSQKLQQNEAMVRTPVANNMEALVAVQPGVFAAAVKTAIVRHVIDTPVYNFEVEDDESYSLLGLSSHNCSLQADTCSYCGNLAPTPKHYCKGMDEGGQCKAGGLTSRMGQLVDVDGDLHHLHADNTNRNLKFGDISHVYRGADRTAYVIGELTKRASATGGIVKSAELAMHLGLYLPASVLIEQAKVAGIDEELVKLACQLADIEDEIESGEHNWVPYYSQAFGKQQDLTTEITKRATDDAVRTSEALARNKLCLSPAAFFHVFGGFDLEKSANYGAAVQPFLPGSFTRLVQTNRFASPFYSSSRSQYKVASFDRIVGDALDELQKFSMSREDVENRATRACLQLEADSNVKIATRLVGLADDNLTALADEYALYKLAFLASANCTPFEVKMSVLSNYTV